MDTNTHPHVSPLYLEEGSSRVKLLHLNDTADIITSYSVNIGTDYSFTWNDNNNK